MPLLVNLLNLKILIHSISFISLQKRDLYKNIKVEQKLFYFDVFLSHPNPNHFTSFNPHYNPWFLGLNLEKISF